LVNVTVPVGVPAPCVTATAAVKTTGWPVTGLPEGDVLETVVAVDAFPTDCVVVPKDVA
jgi:hypothetical protein